MCKLNDRGVWDFCENQQCKIVSSQVANGQWLLTSLIYLRKKVLDKRMEITKLKSESITQARRIKDLDAQLHKATKHSKSTKYKQTAPVPRH
jgi:cell division protein FtsL